MRTRPVRGLQAGVHAALGEPSDQTTSGGFDDDDNAWIDALDALDALDVAPRTAGLLRVSGSG